jgi:tetratricopeptide (TPR) repeat protein
MTVDARQAFAWLAGAVLLLACAFGTHLGGEFVWDDVPLVKENPALDTAAGLRQVLTRDLWGGATGQPAQLYHPAPMATLWAQVRLHGRSLPLLRIGNLAIHLACGLLLWRLLLRLGCGAAVATASSWLFLLHPSVTEPVMWVTGRHDTLGTLAALGALVVWPRAGAPRPWPRALAAAGLTLLAFLCKEQFVVVPALLVGLELLQERRLALVLAPIAALAGGFALRNAAGVPSGSAALHAPPAAQLARLGGIVAHYAMQLGRLADGPTIETWAPASPPAAAVALGATAALAAAAGAALGRGHRRAGPFLFGLGWFVVALAPLLMALPMTGLWANRYAYLPWAGFVVMLACAADAAGARLPGRWALVPAAALAALAVAATPLASAAAARWHDDRALYGDAVRRLPRDGRALYHLASAELRRGGCPLALPLFARAAELAPDYVRAWQNLAGCLLREGRPEEAVAPARHAAALAPRDPRLRLNLGLALAGSGRRDEAAAELRLALALDPASEAARRALAGLGR